MITRTEKALLIASRKDGPWVPVSGLVSIDVSGLGGDDELRLVSRHETLATIVADGVHPVNVIEGMIRVERIAGDSRVTVKACEELCLSIQ